MAPSRILRAGWLVVALFPLACAVAIEPELKDDDGPTPRAGTSSAGTTSVGSTSATGGTTARAGSSSGGTSTSAGKPSTGGSSAAGSGAGGKAGSSSAGASAGGAAGNATAGTTSGGGSSTGCGSLKTWKGGDSTLQIAQGEVIQWMGKRYKATTTIAYPNMECAPDDPVDWCANWFESDGDC